MGQIMAWANFNKHEVVENTWNYAKIRLEVKLREAAMIGAGGWRHIEATVNQAPNGVIVHTEGYVGGGHFTWGEQDFAPDVIMGGIPRRKGWKTITEFWSMLESMSAGYSRPGMYPGPQPYQPMSQPQMAPGQYPVQGAYQPPPQQPMQPMPQPQMGPVPYPPQSNYQPQQQPMPQPQMGPSPYHVQNTYQPPQQPSGYPGGAVGPPVQPPVAQMQQPSPPPTNRFCTNCGAVIEEEGGFCQQCGSSIQ